MNLKGMVESCCFSVAGEGGAASLGCVRTAWARATGGENKTLGFSGLEEAFHYESGCLCGSEVVCKAQSEQCRRDLGAAGESVGQGSNTDGLQNMCPMNVFLSTMKLRRECIEKRAQKFNKLHFHRIKFKKSHSRVTHTGSRDVARSRR